MIALAGAVPVQAMFQMPLNYSADGWVIPPATNNNIYVDADLGNDCNDGLSPSTPKKSISASDDLSTSCMEKGAWQKVMDGDGTTIFLKRGTSADYKLAATLNINKSGSDFFTQPIIFRAYGTGSMPKVDAADLSGQHAFWTDPSGGSNIWILDLVFVGHEQVDAAGVSIAGANKSNWYIEGCTFKNFQFGVIAAVDGLTIRRCTFLDIQNDHFQSDGSAIFLYGKPTYSGSGQSSRNVLIEECYIDGVGLKHPTSRQHGIYVYETVDGPSITIRRNVISRVATDGIKQRPGGFNDYNVVTEAGYSSMHFGQHIDLAGPFPVGFPGWVTIATNFVLMHGGFEAVVPNQSGDPTFIYGPDGPNAGVGLAIENSFDSSFSRFAIGAQERGNNPMGILLGLDPVDFGPQLPIPALSDVGRITDTSIFNGVVYSQTLLPMAGWPFFCQGPSGSPGTFNYQFESNTLRGVDFVETSNEPVAMWEAQPNISEGMVCSRIRFSLPSGASSQYIEGSNTMNLAAWKVLYHHPSAPFPIVPYSNPIRTVAIGDGSYDKFLDSHGLPSGTGLPGSLESWRARVRAMSRDNWPPLMSAENIVNYVLAGFGR